MATRASDYKRVTSKSRRSPDYVASKREDRPLSTKQKAKLRKESSRVMHQSVRIHCEKCGTYTTRVVPSGKGQLKCQGCGHWQSPPTARPTRAMAMRYLLNRFTGLFGGGPR